MMRCFLQLSLGLRPLQFASVLLLVVMPVLPHNMLVLLLWMLRVMLCITCDAAGAAPPGEARFGSAPALAVSAAPAATC
jgi:hypothetical protein